MHQGNVDREGSQDNPAESVRIGPVWMEPQVARLKYSQIDREPWSSPFSEAPGPAWAFNYLPQPEVIADPPMDISTKVKDKFGDLCIPAQRLQPLEELGVGGYAVVTKCLWKTESGQEEMVAVKRLKRDFLVSEREVATFYAEAQLLGNLQHPNIVGFRGVSVGAPGGVREQTESICLVQEYLNSGSLKDLVIQQYMQPSKRVYTKRQGLLWLLEVARGLEYLHRLNVTVIHRDLKLENILLHRDTKDAPIVAKIADFGLGAMVRKPCINGRPKSDEISYRSMGLVKRMSGGIKRLGSNLMKQFSTVGEALDATTGPRASASSLLRRLSHTISKDITDPEVHNLSGRTGSLLYMAPEVILCQQYNEKVDVFSFAVCMYEVMCGAWLLTKVLGSSSDPSKDVERYAQKVANGFRNPVSAFWPQDLKHLVEDCWAQSARERPNMHTVVKRLESMIDSGMYLNDETDSEPHKCCTVQ